MELKGQRRRVRLPRRPPAWLSWTGSAGWNLFLLLANTFMAGRSLARGNWLWFAVQLISAALFLVFFLMRLKLNIEMAVMTGLHRAILTYEAYTRGGQQ